jgi:hypothetical protein
MAFAWKLCLRLLVVVAGLRRHRYRYVCACGYRKVDDIRRTADCPYCYREITPERVP